MDKMDNRTDKRAIQIIKLTGLCKLLIFALALLQLTGCVKDDLYNTPHPDKGAVEVTTDWSGASSDAVLPQNYVLRIGTQEQTVSGASNAFRALFEPGRQDLLVYHPAEGITIDGDIATVNTLADGTLEPMPGFLFSGASEPVIVKDDTLEVTVKMEQHIRTLTLALKLNPGDEERITATSATLTGIASGIDLRDGAIAATGGMTAVPVFALGTNGPESRAAVPHGQGMRSAGEPALVATLRLMGIVTEERQMLTLVITLTDGSVQTIRTDLTEMLKNFGGTDMEPLTLDATLELPAEGSFTASISDWAVVDNGQIEIH
ncbi:FimB/Mfa2 family fimbrial subunit [uncultured Bacteroides sp.]|uniref:FimB/Mfa2 family fimbrial subunit n=1 Tax=uncultured Bacteroides sp. TaxID=162156 RepID=UPI0025F98E29|nr:FimB/Mfa2 family fimbrial subunit [uncultured Bacteroides sp.]